jgi:hypothetical protein
MADVKFVSVGAAVKVPAGITQLAAAVGLKLSDGELAAVIVPEVRAIGATEPVPLNVRVLPLPLSVKAPLVRVRVPTICLPEIDVIVTPLGELIITLSGPLLPVGHAIAFSGTAVQFKYSKVEPTKYVGAVPLPLIAVVPVLAIEILPAILIPLNVTVLVDVIFNVPPVFTVIKGMVAIDPPQL